MDRSATVLQVLGVPRPDLVQDCRCTGLFDASEQAFCSLQSAGAGQGPCDKVAKAIQVVAHKLEQIVAHFQAPGGNDNV